MTAWVAPGWCQRGSHLTCGNFVTWFRTKIVTHRQLRITSKTFLSLFQLFCSWLVLLDFWFSKP